MGEFLLIHSLTVVVRDLEAALELIDETILSIEPQDGSQRTELLIEARQQIAKAIALVRPRLAARQVKPESP